MGPLPWLGAPVGQGSISSSSSRDPGPGSQNTGLPTSGHLGSGGICIKAHFWFAPESGARLLDSSITWGSGQAEREAS